MLNRHSQKRGVFYPELHSCPETKRKLEFRPPVSFSSALKGTSLPLSISKQACVNWSNGMTSSSLNFVIQKMRIFAPNLSGCSEEIKYVDTKQLTEQHAIHDQYCLPHPFFSRSPSGPFFFRYLPCYTWLLVEATKATSWKVGR